jgi:hypothetical protein
VVLPVSFFTLQLQWSIAILRLLMLMVDFFLATLNRCFFSLQAVLPTQVLGRAAQQADQGPELPRETG